LASIAVYLPQERRSLAVESLLRQLPRVRGDYYRGTILAIVAPVTTDLDAQTRTRFLDEMVGMAGHIATEEIRQRALSANV
jgi:hypothetical protein